MAELTKSGTATDAKSQVDPAKTRPASERGDVTLQDAKKQLTSRAFVAVLVRRALDRALQKRGFSVQQESSPWLKAETEDKKSILLQLKSSHQHWANQEIKSFKSAAQRTPEELKAAREQLKVRTYGTQILLAQKGITPLVGWLNLSPELRKTARKDFDKAYKSWASGELRQHTAGASKKHKTGSLSTSLAENSQTTRNASVRTWEQNRPKQNPSNSRAKDNTQAKTPASAKDTAAPDNER